VVFTNNVGNLQWPVVNSAWSIIATNFTTLMAIGPQAPLTSYGFATTNYWIGCAITGTTNGEDCSGFTTASPGASAIGGVTYAAYTNQAQNFWFANVPACSTSLQTMCACVSNNAPTPG